MLIKDYQFDSTINNYQTILVQHAFMLFDTGKKELDWHKRIWSNQFEKKAIIFQDLTPTDQEEVLGSLGKIKMKFMKFKANTEKLGVFWGPYPKTK